MELGFLAFMELLVLLLVTWYIWHQCLTMHNSVAFHSCSCILILFHAHLTSYILIELTDFLILYYLSLSLNISLCLSLAALYNYAGEATYLSYVNQKLSPIAL